MTGRRFSPKPRPADTAALTALYGVAQEDADDDDDDRKVICPGCGKYSCWPDVSVVNQYADAEYAEAITRELDDEWQLDD